MSEKTINPQDSEQAKEHIENQICLKCGGEDKKIEFIGESAKYEHLEQINGDVFMRKVPTEKDDEKLLLTCVRCNYSWFSYTYKQIVNSPSLAFKDIEES